MRAIAKTAKRSRATKRQPDARELLELVRSSLDDDKAEAAVVIDLAGKTSFADYMVVASGRGQRHVGAIAEHLLARLKPTGVGRGRAEGMPQCDWVLIDAGDVIVHLFRPEVRAYYNLEKMWGVQLPEPTAEDGTDTETRTVTV